MSEEIIYQDEDHTYWVNGKRIPCVSDIVKPLSVDYSKIHGETLERKRIMGKNFHAAIALYLKADLDEDSFPNDFPELVKPMEGFIDYWLDVKRDMKNTLHDWKLRLYDPIGDPIRMAGYEELAKANSLGEIKIEKPLYHPKLRYAGTPDLICGEPKKKIVVCFDSEGNYRVYDAHKKQAWSIFRELLKHYYDNQKFGELINKYKESCK